MSDLCPTVKIINKDSKDGYSIINESDFVKTKMKLYTGKITSEVKEEVSDK